MLNAIDIDHLKTWIGKTREVEDFVTPRMVSSLQAIFDMDIEAGDGAVAPPGIHWTLAPDISPTSELGADGHPARGGFLPPISFPRRMWAGSEVEFFGDILVGDKVTRHTRIEDLVLKKGRSGELCFLTLAHEYRTPRGIAIKERQHLVYRPLGDAAAPQNKPKTDETSPSLQPDHTVEIDASAVLLFRYSAVTFNGHRIHYDRPYVEQEEGYPGLLVHGPLQASLLLNQAIELNENTCPTRFSFRGVQPLIGGQRISLNARRVDTHLELWTAAESGTIAVTATAHFSPAE